MHMFQTFPLRIGEKFD